MPHKVAEGIRALGLREVLRSAHFVGALEVLLQEIELLRWDLVEGRNYVVPEESNGFTPFYTSGDWVAFQPEPWKTSLPPEMYLEEDKENPGFDVRGRRSRGVELTGDLRGETEYHGPTVPLWQLMCPPDGIVGDKGRSAESRQHNHVPLPLRDREVMPSRRVASRWAALLSREAGMGNRRLSCVEVGVNAALTQAGVSLCLAEYGLPSKYTTADVASLVELVLEASRDRLFVERNPVVPDGLL